MTTTDLQPQQRKVPFAYAAGELAAICDMLDAGQELDAILVEKFKSARLDLADSVDRRVTFLGFCEAAIDHAKKARDSWTQQARRLEGVFSRVKELTVEVITANPDLPYKGDIGNLRVQKSPPSIDIHVPTKEISARYVVDDELITKNEIPANFVKELTFKQLNIEEIRKHLGDDKEVPFAKKTQGSHLRWK